MLMSVSDLSALEQGHNEGQGQVLLPVLNFLNIQDFFPNRRGVGGGLFSIYLNVYSRKNPCNFNKTVSIVFFGETTFVILTQDLLHKMVGFHINVSRHKN